MLNILAWGAIRFAHFTPGYRCFACGRIGAASFRPLGLLFCLERTNHNDQAQARQNSRPAHAKREEARLPIFKNGAGQALFCQRLLASFLAFQK